MGWGWERGGLGWKFIVKCYIRDVGRIDITLMLIRPPILLKTISIN